MHGLYLSGIIWLDVHGNSAYTTPQYHGISVQNIFLKFDLYVLISRFDSYSKSLVLADDWVYSGRGRGITPNILSIVHKPHGWLWGHAGEGGVYFLDSNGLTSRYSSSWMVLTTTESSDYYRDNL